MGRKEVPVEELLQRAQANGEKESKHASDPEKKKRPC